MRSKFHSKSIDNIFSTSFDSKLFVNNLNIDVKIYYRKNLQMIVTGLQLENPPHLKLERNYVLASYDNVKPIKLENNSGFQIYRILDPRIIFDDKFKTILKKESKNFMMVHYDISKISRSFGFPKELNSIFPKNLSLRQCIFNFENDMIKEMHQRSVSPTTDFLSVFFMNND